MANPTGLPPLSRRAAFSALAGGAAGALLGAGEAGAQGRGGPVRIDVDQGNIRPRPIAVPHFLADDPRLGQEIADVVAADLERSGLFQPLDRRAFVEQIRDINGPFRFADWRAGGAEALIAGRVQRTGDGRIEAQFRLWDVVLERALEGQRVATPAQSWRRIAHIIADRVYEKLTLERGYFDTRIVFIDETGPKDRRIKRLAMMDQDGHGMAVLSQGQELALTPRFSPTRQEITFVAYQREQPRVMIMSLETRERYTLGDMPGMTFAPRFSPDGGRIVCSLGQGGDSSIIEVDLRTRQPRALTQARGIDTGPCYAPDGRAIVFESDREGNQQLYVMGVDGSQPRRLSSGEGRYSTPVWSPRGDFIAFTKQLPGKFLIGVMRPDGGGERILTDGYHNEGPSWAPNGRVLMFFREQQGAQGGPKLFTVDLTGRNERQVPTPAFGSDPAWSPLLR